MRDNPYCGKGMVCLWAACLLLDLAIITGYYSLLCSAHGVRNARMLQSTTLRWRESLFFLSFFSFFPPFLLPFFFFFFSFLFRFLSSRRGHDDSWNIALRLFPPSTVSGEGKKRRVINYRRIYATRDDEESVEPFGNIIRRVIDSSLSVTPSVCKLEMIDDTRDGCVSSFHLHGSSCCSIATYDSGHRRRSRQECVTRFRPSM